MEHICLVLFSAWSRYRATGHQHRLHVWALHLCGHPVREQGVAATVPRWSATHPVHQQVGVYDEIWKSHHETGRLWMCWWNLCLVLCSLQGKLDLNSTLKKAEHHLYNYCKRCAWDYMSNHCRANKSKGEDFFYQLRNLLVLKWWWLFVCTLSKDFMKLLGAMEGNYASSLHTVVQLLSLSFLLRLAANYDCTVFIEWKFTSTNCMWLLQVTVPQKRVMQYSTARRK